MNLARNSDVIRRQWSALAVASGLLYPCLGTNAIAAPFQSNLMGGAAPIAITIGATIFGIGATIFALLQRKNTARHQSSAVNELAKLRLHLDQYEALLAAMPEVTIVWSHIDDPKVLGDVASICGDRKSERDVLNFSNWIESEDARRLNQHAEKLLVSGKGFEISVTNRDGDLVRAVGRPSGNGAALRLRLATAGSTQVQDRQHAQTVPVALLKSAADEGASGEAAQRILGALQKPAWARNKRGELIFANAAYRHLATDLGMPNTDISDLPEIFSARNIREHLGTLGASSTPIKIAAPLADYPDYELILFNLDNGTAGYLGHVAPNAALIDASRQSHIPDVIRAMSAPVIVYSGDGQVVHFNTAYAQLWGLDEKWLQNGVSEKEILDRLRTNNLLPAVPNYQDWRRDHLKNYAIKKATEQTWHLPDGRTINFVVAPATGTGGLIYVYEDVTEKLRLETEKKALVNVQRETLNALSEGVAVFSTDGRLRLHNPRVSALWKLPLNKLGQRPHINELSEEMAIAFPEDGRRIWTELKHAVINLSPQRNDGKGRFTRSDGRLIDYAAIHLPDGQTMLTFVDVTQSTNYERMLKERNEALEVADRLKDAFVQSVSYELRSPLTNIIGFADLLSSDAFGQLNERQRQYTDYIRASSATLGVLIDNILDLTNVDAGIAELNLEQHHISELVKKARAGIDGAFVGTNDEQPINLMIDLPEDLPVITADGKRVVQVLYNLLSNAARFSEAGSKVTLRAESAESFVRFIVEDEGFGVPAELRNALFQRFEGRTIAGRQRGVGIGLTIAQAFVDLHGGKIAFEDRTPHGTKVTVTLPIVTQVQAAPPQPAEAGRGNV